MTSTDIRSRRNRIRNTTNINNVPVAFSASPESGDALVYNATSDYYEFAKVATANSGSAQQFDGDVTFTGTFQIGANGTALHEVRHGIDAYNPGQLNVGQAPTRTVTFNPPFSAAPRVQLIVESNHMDDEDLIILLNGAPTTASFSYRYTNWSQVSDGDLFKIHWFAYV